MKVAFDSTLHLLGSGPPTDSIRKWNQDSGAVTISLTLPRHGMLFSSVSLSEWKSNQFLQCLGFGDLTFEQDERPRIERSDWSSPLSSTQSVSRRFDSIRNATNKALPSTALSHTTTNKEFRRTNHNNYTVIMYQLGWKLVSCSVPWQLSGTLNHYPTPKHHFWLNIYRWESPTYGIRCSGWENQWWICLEIDFCWSNRKSTSGHHNTLVQGYYRPE